MKAPADLVSPEARALLAAHGLDDFEALWRLDLPLVDLPNTERGGSSRVSRLDVGEAAFYLKRQLNYLTHSLHAPLGEPTFARECRMIARYAAACVPALQMAYYGERRLPEGRAAILLTWALTGWQDFGAWLARWQALPSEKKSALLAAAGHLIARLHAAFLCHGACYPKHLFVRENGNAFKACFIDLEKTRPRFLLCRDRIKDLEQFTRHLPQADTRQLLACYLDCPADAPQVEKWLQAILRRKADKAGRI
ncbi:MAG: lipopolysaccharide kinase InaA family protein [Zoogloeaceae bacterium]|jgi:hypothetical protein|nr:lipopolysaccharide kinase InaA family protein [Zoogloeaceae bacterium]